MTKKLRQAPKSETAQRTDTWAAIGQVEGGETKEGIPAKWVESGELYKRIQLSIHVFGNGKRKLDNVRPASFSSAHQSESETNFPFADLCHWTKRLASRFNERIKNDGREINKNKKHRDLKSLDRESSRFCGA